MVERKALANDVYPYSLGVTFGELKSYCESIVVRFQESTGIAVSYEPGFELPLTVGKTAMGSEGSGSILVGMNGIAVVDPNDEKIYSVDVSDDTLVPDRNVACCLMTLRHELQHVVQNYGEWTKDPDGRAPESLLFSHLAFAYNEGMYLQSHVRNIRETDADSVGFSDCRDDLMALRPGMDTDAIALDYINSRWDDGRVYRIGKENMAFESVEEVEQAFRNAVDGFASEEAHENPYNFHDTLSLWTDPESHLAMVVRPLDKPDGKHSGKMVDMSGSRMRWAPIFQSIQNSKTRAEFDRKAASVMLYIHPEYREEFNLDGIDLSPRAVFGIRTFPESAAYVRDRLGIEKKPFWVVWTRTFKEDVPEPEEDLVLTSSFGGGTAIGVGLRAKMEQDRRSGFSEAQVRTERSKEEMERSVSGTAASAEAHGKEGGGGRKGPGS